MHGNQKRTAQIARITIVSREIGMDEDALRDFLSQLTNGRTNSRAQLTDDERVRVLNHLSRLEKATGKKEDPRIGKMLALWNELHVVGHVRVNTREALEKWVFGQTKMKKLDWLKAAQLVQCIEALKAWLARPLKDTTT